MKKTLSLVLCMALLLSVCGAMAEAITFPYDGEEVVYHGFAYDGLNQDPTQPGMIDWQEHIGNIKVEYEFIAYSDYQEKAQIMLATGDMPDILPIWDITKFIGQYGDSGILLDFNEYIDYMPNLQKYLETYPNLNYICDSEGHRYGIVGVEPIDYTGETWFANMDVLRAAGIETVPQTFDEFLEDCRKVKANDPTIVPFQSYWNLPYTMGWIGRSAIGDFKTGVVSYNTETNEYECVYRGENAEQRKQLIEIMHTMYEEGLINAEIATMSEEQERAIIGEGKFAFSGLYMKTPEVEIFKVNPGEKMPYDIVAMLPPTAPDGFRYMNLAYQHDGLPGWGIVCSANAPHPELLAAYMDQVVSPYGRDNFRFGVEGVTFDYIDGVPTWKEGVDRTGYERTQYEVWMVGMGMPSQPDEGNIQGDIAKHINLDAFLSGEMKATFSPVFTTFGSEEAAEKASMENDLNTYINENEALFVYGQRDLAEWDQFLTELEGIADIDALLELYANAETIVRDPNRVFVAN